MKFYKYARIQAYTEYFVIWFNSVRVIIKSKLGMYS